ncbi:MAG: DUF1467 family protein [Pseudomonadota bacterium]
MSVIGSIISFLLIWWVLLFTVLPWGAQSAHETGQDVEPGNEPSAPLKPNMGKKLLITTVLSIPVWLLYFASVQFDLAPWDILTPESMRGDSYLDEPSS